MSETARRTGIRIIGPNRLGIISPHAGLNASFAASTAVAGNIAFLSQSGAVVSSFSIGAKQVTPATYATALALFAKEELLHYSVLIASYTQVAILFCMVGQELHDHQSPGLPE